MNALFGIFHPNGEPVEQHDLAAMQASLSYWERDGAAIWRSGAIGLGCVLQNNHSDVYTRVLCSEPSCDISLVASARIYNAPELAHLLDLPETGVGVDHIILAAYRRWGVDCVYHFDGDWHFALWDSGAKRLLLARDHHGSSSLYYYNTPHRFLFGSSQKPLLALSTVTRKPNLMRVAQILTGWRGDGTQTAYADINRLPPAHYLTLDANGLRTVRYWFPENIPEQRLPRDDDYVDSFLAVFRQAIYYRMTYPGIVGVQLSGGLDSGGVAALASAIAFQQGRKISAYTSVPIGPPAHDLAHRGPADEGPSAFAIAQFAGNIIWQAITAVDVAPVSGIKKMLSLLDDPSYPASNSYWLAALYAAAREHGTQVLLVGTAGNGTVSWTGQPPSMLPFLLTTGEPGLWTAIKDVCARTGMPWYEVFVEFVLKPLARPVRRSLRITPIPGRALWYSYSPIRSSFAERLDLLNLMAEDGHSPTFHFVGDAQALRWRAVAPGAWTTGAAQFEVGGAHGLDVLDPTADRRVIEFCASVPLEQYNNGRYDRWLIRRALAGLIPDDIRLQRRRGRQASDIVSRVHSDLAAVSALLDQIASHYLAAEVLDTDRMQTVYRKIESNPSSVGHKECSLILLNGLMIGMFLQRF